jgi:hypothetical protein
VSNAAVLQSCRLLCGCRRLRCRGHGLGRNQRDFFDDIETGAAQELQHNGPREAGAVKLDPDLLCGFVDPKRANAVHLRELTEREDGALGGVFGIAKKDVRRHHCGLIIPAAPGFLNGLPADGPQVTLNLGAGPILRADKPAADDAVRVDNPSFGRHLGAVGRIGAATGVEGCAQIDAMAL